MLLESNPRIIIGSIPNNPLKFYVGFTPSVQDTTVLGYLKLVYNAEHKYEIKIMSPPLPPDHCSQYSPEFSLVPNGWRDTLEFVENEYQLWDLEMIESRDDIRNISMQVIYQCDEYYSVKPIIIPISKGMPFGRDSILQTVTLIHPPDQGKKLNEP